jgi:hypothetical protein
MGKNRALAFVALILGIFFLFQLGAEFFFALGQGREPEKRLKNLRISMKLFPTEGIFFNEAGFGLLEAGGANRDNAAVKKSVPYFQAALRKNPLDYQSHYYLAKAYLQLSTVGGEYFDLAVDELKRAARIRGSNKQITLDCSSIFFSLWPLLDDEDRSFAKNLLANAMPTLSWSEFSPLVEMWSLYVQDAPLLMELLLRKPEFFGPAADQLVAAAISMDQRRELLALYEVHTLDAQERRYNELILQGEIGLDNARSLLGQLHQLKGYYRLQPDSGFAPEKLAKLQRTLLLQVISALLTDPKAQTDPKSVLQLREYIQAYIADYSKLNSLDELQKLLEEHNYFKNNDFPSLYLKTMIAYKKGNYGDIINEIETLRQTISFVKKEQATDYTNILLLLIDSYYSSKLLTSAEAIARELYQNQPDNMDVLYRVLRIQSILGDEGLPDKDLNDRLAIVRDSRILKAARSRESFDVYLFNQPEIEIVLDPTLRAQLKFGQLLQVFIEGKIAYESYADALPEKIIIGPPFTGIERKVRVQVSIL